MLYILEGESIRLCHSVEDKKSVVDVIYQNLDSFSGDHYKFYPSKIKDGWKNLLIEMISSNLDNENYIFVFMYNKIAPILFGVRINTWDEEVFGFKLSTTVVTLFNNDRNLISKTINETLTLLKKRGVKSLVFRCNGDQLSLIHVVGEMGFKYYENIIWPVLKTENLKGIDLSNKVRAINEEEYSDAAFIAKKYQYNRGHFYCDKKFEKTSIDNLYAKWVNSCKENDTKVIVIESDKRIAGYFVCKFDPMLKKHLGYNYGRLTSLALNGEYRGRGLGATLFRGTLNLLKNNGADYIDSGYATKNHLSSKLHSSNQFSSVYEEVTFHYWF